MSKRAGTRASFASPSQNFQFFWIDGRSTSFGNHQHGTGIEFCFFEQTIQRHPGDCARGRFVGEFKGQATQSALRFATFRLRASGDDFLLRLFVISS